MKTIVTTVGTSIITNYLSPEGKRQVGNKYVPIDAEWRRLSIGKSTDLEAVEFHNPRYGISVERIRKVLKHRWFAKADGTPNELASAEISSILKMADGRQYRVHLLATDTLQSVLAATLIRDWFEQFKEQYKIEVLFQLPSTEFNKQDDNNFVVKDLQATKGDKYEKGFQNLFFLLNKLSGKKIYRKNIEFNVTGGYKAIIPPIVLFAQLENIPISYLYEGSVSDENELIQLSKLPFGFDHAAWEILEDYISNKELRKKISGNRHKALQVLTTYQVIEPETMELTHIGTLLESFLRERTDVGKSMFGYIAELLVFEYFTKKGKSVRRGERINRNKIAFGSYKEGDPLEVDVVIEREDGTEEWYELKPESKIQRGIDQIVKRLAFNREVLKRNVSKAGLILYVPDFFDSEQYEDGIRSAIERMHAFPEVEFSLLYFKIPFDEASIRTPSKMAITQQGIEKLFEIDLTKFNN